MTASARPQARSAPATAAPRPSSLRSRSGGDGLERQVDQAYFLGRMRASLAMAEAAADAVAKLIHFDLAGRYSVAATRSDARR